MRKLGVSIIGAHPENVSVTDQIRLFSKVGFDCVFIGTTPDTPIDEVKLIAKTAADCGMEIETIHAPFGGVNDLWKDEISGDAYLDVMKTIIGHCHAGDIHKMIMHVTIGNTAPEVSSVGLDRFARLEEYAEERSVHLCYENLEPLPHLHEVMKHAGDYHGFCLDIGHNCCYTPHIPMMQLYGNRLLCTHIHDNLGVTQPGNIDYRDDLHLLPFDGILDWPWFAKTLAATGYKGPLTFELSCANRKEYREVTFEAFVRDAYARAVKIRDMMGE